MWRHGDVFIQVAKKVPDSASKLPHTILAKGEMTGHSHRLEPYDAAMLYRDSDSDDFYVHVTAETATLVHEEHAAISFSQGIYRAWIQREYSPEAIRRVID